MPHGFDAYRVFISAPGDLQTDRAAAYQAVARANELVAMPAMVLLTSVGLRENVEIEAFRGPVSENVRWSTFFIQIFQDDWGPRDLFRKLFLLALECRDDASMPMRGVAVCVKDAPQERNPEILAFRKELEEQREVQLIRYSDPEQLGQQLEGVCSKWGQELIDLGRPELGRS